MIDWRLCDGELPLWLRLQRRRNGYLPLGHTDVDGWTLAGLLTGRRPAARPMGARRAYAPPMVEGRGRRREAHWNRLHISVDVLRAHDSYGPFTAIPGTGRHLPTQKPDSGARAVLVPVR